jgi:uncharacterized SAM-binding protein YcdF (DUF218 family)
MLWLNYTRAAKRLLTLISLAGLLLLVYPVSDHLLYPLESQFEKPQKMPEHIDGIIVLGGAENLKLSLSWQSAEVGDAAERILTAAELSRFYPDKPVIYSGGSNLVQRQNLDTEGSVASRLLVQAGIDESNIVMEPKARNTHENFMLIKNLLPEKDGQFLLVTSAFHMPRSVGVARKLGLNVIPYPVDYRTSQPTDRYYDFDLFAHLQVLEIAWHEWLGLTAYFLTDKTASWLPKAEAKQH